MPNVLTSGDRNVDMLTTVVPPASIQMLLVPPASQRTVVQPPVAIQMTLAVGQGPAGAPGTGEVPTEPILRLDASRPIAYVGYEDRIERLDYSTYPPQKATALVSDIEESWPGRSTLSYQEVA